MPRPAIVEPNPFGQLLRDVAAYQGRQANLAGKALQLLALTFVRPGTVLQAEWSEIDLDSALWTIPFIKLKQRRFRERIKELKDKPHYVPLSRQAVALLRDLKTLTGNGRYVFPGPRGGRPLTTDEMDKGCFVPSPGIFRVRSLVRPRCWRSSVPTASFTAAARRAGQGWPRLYAATVRLGLDRTEHDGMLDRIGIARPRSRWDWK